jgi:lysophospholipid acyltransferase 5
MIAKSSVILQGHLLLGYWVHETHEYDINWTTPHCILTLRMIGLVIDVYDGHQQKPKDAAAREDKTSTAIDDQPTLLEVAAYAYFPTACLAGPQVEIFVKF